MGSQSSERARMRQDLRDLAKLAAAPQSSTATPPPPQSSVPAAASSRSTDATPHGFATADSSGYVDLSAFSASDEGWVDRELSRAKGGAVLTPGSMAPMSMAALLGPEPVEERKSKRGWVYASLGLVGVAAVGALAVAVMRNAPHAAPKPGATIAAAAPAPPPATTAGAPKDPNGAPNAANAAPPSAASAAASSSAASAPSAVAAAPSPTDSTAASSRKHGARGHVASAAAAPPAHVAASKPAAPSAPASPAPVAAAKPAPAAKSGDSLLDMIRASVANKK
jgi:hypothetical protein